MSGVLIAVLLLAHFGAHVALVFRLRGRVAMTQVVLSFFLAPIAPYHGFRTGLTRHSWLWIGTLALYAAVVGLVRGCV